MFLQYRIRKNQIKGETRVPDLRLYTFIFAFFAKQRSRTTSLEGFDMTRLQILKVFLPIPAIAMPITTKT
jgi:hypothetical protein